LLGDPVEDLMRTLRIAAAAIALVAFRPSVSAAQQPAPPSPASQSQPATQPPQPTVQPLATSPAQPASQPRTQPPAPGLPPPVGTAGEMVPTPVPTCTPADVSTALPLLDRIQRLLDEASKDHLGKVDMDRATIDEIRAEVAQIRVAIQPVKR
jgi:hypothetical protein